MPTDALVIAKEKKALMGLMDTAPYRIPRREVDENLLIATWNIAQFTNSKKARALQYIADICERFDIVAVQEVKNDLRGLSRRSSSRASRRCGRRPIPRSVPAARKRRC